MGNFKRRRWGLGSLHFLLFGPNSVNHNNDVGRPRFFKKGQMDLIIAHYSFKIGAQPHNMYWTINLGMGSPNHTKCDPQKSKVKTEVNVMSPFQEPLFPLYHKKNTHPSSLTI